jgi:hypothetical protein
VNRWGILKTQWRRHFDYTSQRSKSEIPGRDWELAKVGHDFTESEWRRDDD